MIKPEFEALLVADGTNRDAPSRRVTALHYSLVALFAIVLTLLSPRGKSYEFSRFTIGSVSSARVIAPFDFEILKSPDELHDERLRASDGVLPVLVRDNTAEDSTRQRLQAFEVATRQLFTALPAEWLAATADSSEDYSSGKGEPFLKGSQAIASQFKIRISGDQWRLLFRLYLTQRGRGGASLSEFFGKIAPEALIPIYSRGLLKEPYTELAEAGKSVVVRHGIEEESIALDSLTESSRLAPVLNSLLAAPMSSISLGRPNEVEAAAGLIAALALPNLEFNHDETTRRRDAAIASVPLAKGFVKQDELIVDSHIRITQEHFDKLNSLAVKRAEQTAQLGGWHALLPTFGQFVLAGVLSLFLWVSIALARASVWRERKQLLLIFGIVSLALVFYRFLPVSPELARQLLPSAAVGMLLTILFDRGVAALGVIVLALSAGFVHGNDFQTVATALGLRGASIISIRSLNSRKDVLRGGFYIGAVAAVIATGFHFANYTSTETFFGEILAAVGNGVFTPMLVLGIMPLVEGLFGVSTDLTLLELVDLNRPLLRELAIKSPGTYHHSLMVGSLAEAAAREVGANPILTRAGAYYHDIGKIEIKEYFIENQETGSSNIHDQLPPTKSADIVIGHVQRGLELAAKHKLPPNVTAFITEHHGQTRLAFFHAKAQRELGQNVAESRFRYPGPKPASKETGILMLADVVEAATRSLDHPTPLELRETVDRLVATRLGEGDLDNCPLTLSELQRIKDSFLRVLIGMHHQRISYPEKSTDTGIRPELAAG